MFATVGEAVGVARARRNAGSYLLGVGLTGLVGCSLAPSRGPVADFFFKDYDRPPYRADQAAFHRHRRIVEPDGASAIFGGVMGAVVGGRAKAWRMSAAGALGGLGGAAVAQAYDYAAEEEPLPEAYDALALALPIIATDPNKGPTVGLLPVGVVNEGGRITNIFAPDVTYNEIDGLGGIFRMRRTFSRDAYLNIDAGTSTEGNDDYEAIYSQRRVGPNQFLYYKGRVGYRTSLANRFFGVGNETEEEDESTYVFRRTTAEAVLGIELPLDVTIELKERIVSSKVGPGRLERIPSTRVLYADVEGVRDDRTTILTHQIRLTYDNRDSRNVPTEGVFAEFLYEVADSTLGSDIAFHRFGLSVTALFPKLGGRLVTAARLSGMFLIGDKVPFYELTVVGGKQTVRGYGYGRFRGRNAYVANIEERFNFPEFTVAGYGLVVQLAAFLDAGRVFDEGERFTLADSHLAAGGAVRMIVPNSEIVASIDMGFSDEGSAVFVGLDYPF